MHVILCSSVSFHQFLSVHVSVIIYIFRDWVNWFVVGEKVCLTNGQPRGPCRALILWDDSDIHVAESGVQRFCSVSLMLGKKNSLTLQSSNININKLVYILYYSKLVTGTLNYSTIDTQHLIIKLEWNFLLEIYI